MEATKAIINKGKYIIRRMPGVLMGKSFCGMTIESKIKFNLFLYWKYVLLKLQYKFEAYIYESSICHVALMF